ncbi:MAG TPA: FAD:protein FMN transferase [Candidatus Dormibacteraeota bacterium]|nr:FAD:protein FMN transferase [Candidatus Dormibacteraeota bacterium]
MLTFDSFAAIGTINTVVVDEPGALNAAMEIVQEEIREIDRACSRFRDDSELSHLNRIHGRDVELSPLLEEAIVAALHTAEMTAGLVDLTVGKCVEDVGYTVTFRDLPADGPAIELHVQRIVGSQALAYDPLAHTLRLPEAVTLDLGASGKAWAADRCADAVRARLGVSVAVDCGGDIAVRGPHPAGGWPIRVATDVGADEWQDIVLFDGGLATSGTTARRWRRGGVDLHHIIDPATGMPAQTPWAMVSVAAATCVEANAAATAALIMGERAPRWLDEARLPARLVGTDGGVCFAGGWSG